MALWMVRKENFTFLRPMSKKELIKIIEAGALRGNDEVCEDQGHWFSLFETSEIRNAFGDIKLDKLYARDTEDITSETSTKAMPKTIILTAADLKNASGTRVAPLGLSTPQPEETPEPQKILKGVIFVLIAFSVFILVLISFWLRTY